MITLFLFLKGNVRLIICDSLHDPDSDSSIHYFLLFAPQVLSLVSQFLLLRYGAKYSSDLGFAFSAFVTASSASLLSSAVLLFVYLVSTKTLHRVRSSLYVSAAQIG